MSFGGQSQCYQQPDVGYTPLTYFILGVIEVSFSIGLALIVFKRSITPSISQSVYVSFILPVYLLLLCFLLALTFLIGLDRIVGLYPVDLHAAILRWFLVRTCADGLSVFFVHHGIGSRSMKNSALFGISLSSCNALTLFMVLLYTSGYGYFAAVAVLICIELLVLHGTMAFAPARCLHRRPAALRFSALNCALLLIQLAVLVVALELGRQRSDDNSNSSRNSRRDSGDSSADCAVEIVFAFSEFLQIIVIIYAFVSDSMYWQGLYSDKNSNLNHPLLGIWDLNNRSAVQMVADSIVLLERKVVYIIPYSQLIVDTSKYFSGGSARVYRGMYSNNEVAIKFLFCIELTPERVIEFCNEATLLNSLEHENVVHCYGVAIMPPAISLVTEYCTFGSLFDFLHSADWIVTADSTSENPDGESEGDSRDGGGERVGGSSGTGGDADSSTDNSLAGDGTASRFPNTTSCSDLEAKVLGLAASTRRSSSTAAATAAPSAAASDRRSMQSDQQLQHRGTSAVHIEKVQRHLMAAVQRREQRSRHQQQSLAQAESTRSSEQNALDSFKLNNSLYSSSVSAMQTNSYSLTDPTRASHQSQLQSMLHQQEPQQQQQQRDLEAALSSTTERTELDLNRISVSTNGSRPSSTVSASTVRSSTGDKRIPGWRPIQQEAEHRREMTALNLNIVASASTATDGNPLYASSPPTAGSNHGDCELPGAIERKSSESSMRARSWSNSNQQPTSVIDSFNRRIVSLNSPTNSNGMNQGGHFFHTSSTSPSVTQQQHQQQIQYQQQQHFKMQHMSSHHSRRALRQQLANSSNSYKHFSNSSLNSSESGNSERMQSAMSVMLSRELRYGLGPDSVAMQRQPRSIVVHNTAGATTAVVNNNAVPAAATEGAVVYKKTTIECRGSWQPPSVLLSCVSSSVFSLTHLLPLTAKLRMARDCCAGLAYLHSRNLMHCDIKSLNFLVTNDLVVKLADLGETRPTRSTISNSGNFNSINGEEDVRSVPRSINWSSPEILTLHQLPRDEQPSAVTQAADVWSLAMVVWEILSGEVPFDHAEYRSMDIETFVEHLKDGLRPPLPRELGHYLWLRDMLNQAWEFYANERITAAQMCEILDDHMI